MNFLLNGGRIARQEWNHEPKNRPSLPIYHSRYSYLCIMIILFVFIL